ncbi:MAG: hypothetical protein ABFS08_09090 [Pseudomonadota bacterium]
MKSSEYRKKFSKDVLETDVIFDCVNQNSTGMNLFPLEQMEMIFDESNESASLFCVERDASREKVDFNMSDDDISEQNSYYNAAKVPLKVMCYALHQEYADIEFRVERNTNNNSNKGSRALVDRLQLLAVSERGEPIDLDRMLDVRSTVNSLIDEINSLILQINSTVDVKDISSVILCAEHEREGRTNAVPYKTRGAAEFVYAYFNTGKAIRRRLLRLRLGSEVRELKEAKSPTHKIEYSASPHVIIGSLVPESISRNIYILKGHYAANDDLNGSGEVFNHEVFLSEKQRKNSELLDRLTSMSHSQSVEVTVYPVQPYVCITGVRSKKLALVDIKANV